MLAALALAFLAAPGVAETLRVPFGDGMVASVSDRQEIYLETLPLAGEGLLAFTRRLTGSEEARGAIAVANGGAERLLAGVRYRVPFAVLTGEHQLRLLRALFPEDRCRTDAWVHVVTPAVPGQGLWHVAEWFTGRGENFTTIRAKNGLADDTIRSGQQLAIPAQLLLPALRAALPPDSPHRLEYVREGGEEYAVYRLLKGEALYSSVVVRFTGRTFADDVKALAGDLARLNAIPDVTDIPVGQAVRIPFDLLLPEFLPPGHPRRIEYEQDLTASARYSNTVRASRLEGITVILDAGHGGSDPGAMVDGISEASHVYDIMLRVKRLLEETTAAQVVPTVRDGQRFRLEDRDRLPLSRGHAVLTTPPYPIEDASTAVNLRWYLANSLYAQAVQRGGDGEKVVFLSLHADSLHSSLRGAMVYIPATSLTRGSYAKSGSVYQAREEVRQHPRVEFAWKERVQSEGLSRQLAERLIASFEGHDLVVHKERPVRDRIIRRRRSRPFVPAVIRYNAVPAKVLLEVCNLNNSQDRRLLETRDFRQSVAEAIVDGILDYYGQAPGAPETRIARAAR